MKCSSAVARDHEDRGIGLLAGAYYVLGGNLDDDLLREVGQQDFRTMQWKSECRLIVVNGQKVGDGRKGKLLIRFGRVDESERFIRLVNSESGRTVFASLPLLRATHHDPADFVLRNLSGRICRARKITKQIDQVGLVIGDSERFASLLSLKGDNLLAIDVEETGTGREATVLTPVADQEANGVRAVLRETLTKVRFLPDHPCSVNIQLVFARTNPTP